MPTVAYLYLPTPPRESVQSVFESIIDSGITISHFGSSDPPKRWEGNTQDIAKRLLDQPEDNKYAFLKDKEQGLSLSLELFYDPRWTHSTLSLSGESQSKIESIALQLATRLNPYICIQGTSGGGKDQPWQVLHKRADCPSIILNAIPKA